jgi:hypothetical protein
MKNITLRLKMNIVDLNFTNKWTLSTEALRSGNLDEFTAYK